MRKVEEYFLCEHCGKKHKSEEAYEKCVLGHDIVYIGLEREEWKSLFNSILTAAYGGFEFNPEIIKKLMKYRKVGVTL